MPIPITVPRLGWNMEEGTFLEWLKADGDAVRPGDMVFRLEGEKAAEEIETFDGGILHIPANSPKPGDRVAVGATIGLLLQPGEAKPGPGAPDPGPVRTNAEQVTPQTTVEPAASPAARRMARERGIDLRTVRGTGRSGRVTPEDVELSGKPATESRAQAAPTISPRARRLATQHNFDWTRLRGTGRTGRIRERDIAAALGELEIPAPTAASILPVGAIPLTATRKAIATRMVKSLQSTAPVTLTSEVNAANLVNLREQFKAVAKTDGRLVPAYTDFLLKLVAAALQQHPALASRWTDAGLLPAARIDMGLAVDTDAGLLVPVVRDVPALGLRQIAEQTRALIDRARGGKLAARDMEGGCFTVTSLGSYGVDGFTPIINYPECAILGVGRIERKPVMDGDRVIGREQLTLSLTFDHRVVDGGPAARFLQTVARLIENPGPWLAT